MWGTREEGRDLSGCLRGSRKLVAGCGPPKLDVRTERSHEIQYQRDYKKRASRRTLEKSLIFVSPLFPLACH